MTNETRVARTRELVRAHLGTEYPEEVVDECMSEFGLVIAESALTGEQFDRLIEYLTPEIPTVEIKPEEPMLMRVIKERDGTDEEFYTDFDDTRILY